MAKRNVIVIGASAGGLEAFRCLLAALPKDFDAALMIVWHMAPGIRGILPQVLNKVSKLPVAQATDNQIIQPGHVYVAPPDRHMLVESDRLRVTKEPRENGFRPAIDPLFRSAALAFGRRVIGIVLTGSLNDGSAGLWKIKQRGGIGIVQDPDDAEVPSMPLRALETVQVDYQKTLTEIPELLTKLIREGHPG